LKLNNLQVFFYSWQWMLEVVSPSSIDVRRSSKENKTSWEHSYRNLGKYIIIM